MSLFDDEKPQPNMSTKLKKHLFDSYGGFGDKRIKNLAKGNSFIIDDRNPNEANSSGEFDDSHCFIFASGVKDEQIEVVVQFENNSEIPGFLGFTLAYA